MAAYAAYCDNDTVPLKPDAMSGKLATHTSRAGLLCLKPILEQAGVLTYSCLGAVREDELHELCLRVKAAGFGLGHARALRELWAQARAQADLRLPLDRTDEAPVLPSALSPMLYFRLARKGLRELESILAQCGVTSVACLEKLQQEERDELANAITSAGFNAGQVMAEICRGSVHAAADQFDAMSSASGSPATVPHEQPARCREPLRELPAANGDAHGGGSLERPLKRAKLEEDSEINAGQTGVATCDVACAPELQRTASPEGTTTEESKPRRAGSQEGLKTEEPKQEAVRVKQEPRKVDEGSDSPGRSTREKRRLGEWDLESFRHSARVSRDALDDVMRHMKIAPAEIIRYRDKVTGKMQDARVPTAVLALLRLRASCTGKPVSEDRIARLAVDVMEEQGFDPIKAYHALSPASLFCPTSAMRVLGAGAIGTVFLEEESGQVVKAMLEDFAEKEYEVFCRFADAGLAARPIGIHGPRETPGGKVFSIRMEAITHTLHSVLRAREIRGPRLGLKPPLPATARRIAEAIAKALQGMWDSGLVHGDLHLENIAVQDPEQPLIRLLDFGRAGVNRKGTQSSSSADLRAGHEYDVFRLIDETCHHYDEQREEIEFKLKACDKEVADLRKASPKGALLCTMAGKLQDLMHHATEGGKQDVTNDFPSQLHDARQILGLQDYVTEERKGLSKLDVAYTAILTSLVGYAKAKLDLSFEGVIALSNRKMRQAVVKRRRACESGYLKSDLFWGAQK